MINIYQTLLYKQSEDYLPFIDLLVKTRYSNEYKMCAIMRDRGSKVDYIQTYFYDAEQVWKLVNRFIENGQWFSSVYLSWVLYETDLVQNKLLYRFSLFCSLVESNLYRRIIENNRYECYGFCMSVLVLLDKIFLLKFHSNQKYILLKLAVESLISYIYYHKDENALWDAEIYSSYARLFDIYRADMTAILMENNIGSYAQYSYCYGMFEAFKSCPVETSFKLEYHKNALMMQQNQTVVGVTSDPMDANLTDAVSLGEQQFLRFATKMLQYDIVKQNTLIGLTNFLKDLDSAYNIRIQKESGFENLKYLERFFQIEPYDKYGYVSPPYKRTSITYDRLLNEIGVCEANCHRTQLNDGEIVISTDNISLFPKFHLHHDFNKIESTTILFIRIIIRQDKSMKSISVLGINLYELYRDVSKSGLFFNIPCVVGTWDANYSGAMHHLLLLVGTNYDLING